MNPDKATERFAMVLAYVLLTIGVAFFAALLIWVVMWLFAL